MGLLSRIFGGAKGAAPPSQTHLSSGDSQQHSQTRTQSQGEVRRGLLRMALRDTLQRNGIPTGWLGADLLKASSRSGQTGYHWRLVVKHWDPRLLIHSVALQDALLQRVSALDPSADQWLLGISWRMDLADESACPPLPQPWVWAVDPTQAAPAIAGQVASDLPEGPAVPEPASAAEPPDTTPAGIIEGPMHLHEPGDSPKSDLDKLLAVLDGEFKARSDAQAANPEDPGAGRAFQQTEPAGLDRR
jgi:hypothetical protein